MPCPIHGLQLSTVALTHLKARLRARLGDRCVDYSCRVSGVSDSSGVEKVVMEGLGAFEDACFDKMVASATAQYGGEARQVPSAELIADDNHAAFREAMAVPCIGRQAELDRIMSFVASAVGHSKDKGESLDVTGAIGMGKSTVMAAATATLEATGRYRVFYHAGDVESTFDAWLERLASMFAAEAVPAAADDPNADTPTAKDKRAVDTINAAMVAQPDVPIVIVYDGKFGKHNRAAKCPGTRWINSATRHDASNFEVCDKDKETTLLLLPLAPDACLELATQRLAKYKKALDPGQMEMLLSKSLAGFAPWLNLACDEIRMWGVYETIGTATFSIIFGHFSRMPQPCTTPHAPWYLPYFVPMLVVR